MAAAERILGAGRTIADAAANGEVDPALLRDLHLLTAKPFIYVFNVDEGALGEAGLAARLAEGVRPAPAIVLCAEIEAEVAGLDAADAAELLSSYGQEESGLQQLVHVGFATLGLQTFLTAGPKEARAWTIHIGDTAPKAAGVIHTDFERGFIKAEVISFDELMEAGSVAAARTAGRARDLLAVAMSAAAARRVRSSAVGQRWLWVLRVVVALLCPSARCTVTTSQRRNVEWVFRAFAENRLSGNRDTDSRATYRGARGPRLPNMFTRQDWRR